MGSNFSELVMPFMKEKVRRNINKEIKFINKIDILKLFSCYVINFAPTFNVLPVFNL